MARIPPQPHQAVVALMDERDDLQIKISLEADAPEPDEDRLRAMPLRLAHIETEIARQWGDRCA